MTEERYVAYSVDKTNEDDTSLSSERSGSITFRGPDYVDLHITGNGLPSPPVLSTTTDKWGSYWTKRERCCCFCNCFVTVSVIILITLVVLVTQGVVDLRQHADTNNDTKTIISTDIIHSPCSTLKPDFQVNITFWEL